MEKYTRREDRIACLVAGLMLSYALGGDYGERLAFGPHGKPYLEGGPCFNLSHSGEYVVLGVSGGDIGVDVQQKIPYSSRVAGRVLTDPEFCWLEMQPPKLRSSLFARLWTGKESVLKATGSGFAQDPRGFDILPLTDGSYDIHDRRLWLRWLDLPGHALCCASAEMLTAELTLLSPDELLG